MKCTYLGGLPAVQVPGSVGTAWYGPGIGPTLMNNVAWTASHPPGDKLKWKALCGHLMPTDMIMIMIQAIVRHPTVAVKCACTPHDAPQICPEVGGTPRVPGTQDRSHEAVALDPY